MEAKPIFKNLPKYYNIKQLRLDNLNPRLPLERRNDTQIDLLLYMEKYFDLLPIARSMSDNGYFDEEPLIVIPKNDEPDAYIVIEGNRRLAALKFLTDSELRARSIYKDTYEKLAESAVENLNEVPAIRYETRALTQSMLGFRHISGIMKWSAFNKARFIHDFVRDKRELDYSQIARILGVQTSVIRRNYTIYRVYLQAQSLEYDTSRLERNFSIFFTALGYLPIQNYIGIKIANSTVDDFEEPVSERHHDNLNQLILWVHGSETERPIISESRDLKYLSLILKSSDALKYLEAGGRLLDAYSLTESEENSVIDSLTKASYNIDESLRFLHRHKDNQKVQQVVDRCAGSLLQALQHFPDILVKYFPKE